MRLKHILLLAALLVLVRSSNYARVSLDDDTKDSKDDTVFLFIQDICGVNKQLKDSAQSVFSNYMPLLKRSDVVYLGTNNPDKPEVLLISQDDQLELAMEFNRQHAPTHCTASIGATLDSFYLKLKKRTTVFLTNDLSDRLPGKVNVAHVTTVSVDTNKGNYLDKLTSDYNLKMEFVGITKKNDYFENADSFDIFPGYFTQTYDPEVALIDLVGTLGSYTKPAIPPVENVPRCIQKLQAAFTFHTDISSVPRMTEFRSKARPSASKIIQSVTKYFDIPTVKTIDQDDDTCEFNKQQLEDKTQFYGVIYANSSGIGVPTFCMSNMNSYPNTVNNSNYKQAPQVHLQSVIDSFTKWYNSDQKMMCHCFDDKNEKTQKIILWIPLSPTSLDTRAVSFAGFDVVGFKHIVMPFGFTYNDSPLWRSLVPDRSRWTGDASRFNYDIEQIIQDIWTITCRFADHIKTDQTAEPFNPYTTKLPPSVFPRHYLFIQDVCGIDEILMDSAQSVYANYLPLLKSTDYFYLGTNNPEQYAVKEIISVEELNEAMSLNRKASKCTTASIGATLDFFYLKMKHRICMQYDVSDTPMGTVDVAHVTTVNVNSNVGVYLDKMASEYILKMEFVGFTKKHDYFPYPNSFDIFPGNFVQTYDSEVAILDLVDTLGSHIKPAIPTNLSGVPRCINNLQADFTFHTDISSVPRMTEFRSKARVAAQIIQSVTNYFDKPSVQNIDLDIDTCEFNKDQLEDKTQFYGVIYANVSGIGVPTFCMSNMNSYPDTVRRADYKQAPQVNLQGVIDSFTKWYNNDQKMMCHCFDYHNEKTEKIIMWTPLSPTSLDADPTKVSFAGFDVVGFKHIVMPFGFTYDDSPLWRSLVPNRDQWTGDASLVDYEVDQIIQDIWTITCRFAGHIEQDQTAEPFNPYTTVKTRIVV